MCRLQRAASMLAAQDPARPDGALVRQQACSTGSGPRHGKPPDDVHRSTGVEQMRSTPCWSRPRLRFAIEHYRRRMFDCSGSLFWQLNDCWPCINWAVVDYDLNPKAGWYRAYA